ncbi:MAG: ABC transporter permease [Gammaproteobacteria bacterium]
MAGLVFLWTDILIYLLVLVIIVFIVYTRGREHLRAPWRQVARSRLGMCSAVILFTYIVIGLLDSVHFYPKLDRAGVNGGELISSEVISLFDKIVLPLKNNYEKTYSAPFAIHLYAKETIELPEGRQVRKYPRLKYGGAHLHNPDTDKLADILKTSIYAAIHALIAWSVLAFILIAWLACRSGKKIRHEFSEIVKGETDIPWVTILAVTGIVILCIFVSAELSTRYHIFGTDKIGQDVFYQALKSIRTGLVIGTLTTLVMLPFAIFLGISAGYFRGWIDDVVQYIYTTLNSIPSVLLIAAAVLMLQVYMYNHAESFTNLASRQDLRLLFLCFILGVTNWTGLCRLLRGETLKLREVEYIQAAQAFGVDSLTIITRHILPNVLHIVLISVVLDFSSLVLAEAVLAYINIGVDPTMISWGNMINGARLEMAREPIVWWSLAAAFIFMLGLVLSANLFADAVRDAFDPRIRQNS